jgi:gliding motility-associated protein GldM
MAGFKETPRQKMIGMMYLVLTALLALNVSKEILDAFVIVNDSIEKTSANSTNKVQDLYKEFKFQYGIKPDEVGPYYNKSQFVQQKSEELINYIDSLKYAVIAAEESIPYDSAKVRSLENIDAKDKYDASTNLLVSETTKRGEGYKLKKKIDQYRSEMLSIIDEDDRENFKLGLRTDGDYRDADNKPQDWVKHNFYHTIVAANVTIFNKLVNEVRNAEFDVNSYLMRGITKDKLNFTTIEPRILPQTNYVFKGDEYEAEIFMAAIDENSQPTLDYQMNATEWDNNFIGNNDPIIGDSGVVRFSINTSGMETKEYSFSGRLGIVSPDGSMLYKTFSSSFIVAEPSANVSASKMNVLMRGNIKNPIKISASGVPTDKLDPRIIGGGRIERSGKDLFVTGLKPNNTEVTIEVFLKGDDGSSRSLGKEKFRVLSLEDPDIKVGVKTKKTSEIRRDDLVLNPYIYCDVKADQRLFEFPFEVLSFGMSYRKNGSWVDLESNSYKMTPAMVDVIKNSLTGSKIFFKDIVFRSAEGPKAMDREIVVTL